MTILKLFYNDLILMDSFSVLERNAKGNRTVFVLERLHKVRLRNQSNDLKFIFNFNFYDSKFSKILRSNEIEISDFIKGHT